MSRSTIMLGAGLAAGAAIGFMGSLFVADTPHAAGEGLDRPAVADASRVANATTDVDRRAPVVATGEGSDISAGTLDVAMEIAREVHAARVEGGGESLEGIVEDDRGSPIPGVTVRATPGEHRTAERADRGRSAPKPRTLEEVVRTAVERFHETDLSSVEATTGDDGRFSLQGLADRRYSVQAFLGGYDISPKPYRSEPGAFLRFRASEVASVPVEVILPDGTPADEAVLSVRRRDVSQRSEELWERSNPSIALAVHGRYDITAFISDQVRKRLGLDLDYRSAEAEVTLRDGLPHEPILLELRGQPRIHGQVKVPDPSLASTATVWYARVEDAPVDETWLRDYGRSVYASLGRYEINDTRSGTYALAASPHRDLPMSSIELVQVNGLDVRRDLDVSGVPKERCLVLVARTSLGQPVSEIGVTLVTRSASSSSNSWPSVIRRGGGEFWVVAEGALADHLDGASPPGRRATLTVTSQGFAPREVPLPPGLRRVEVTFEAGVKVTARVPAFDASEHLGRLTVSLERRDPDDPERWDHIESESVRADGSAELGPAAAGPHRVRAWLRVTTQGGRRSNTLVGKAELTVTDAPTTVTVPMLPLYKLVVRFDEEATGTVRARSKDDNFSLRATIRDRQVTFRDLAAGDYTVRYYGGNATMTVRVPEQSDVLFEADTLSALQVRLNDGSPLEDRGFRNGDVIVAVDGESFDSGERLRAGMIAADPATPHHVTVIRDGAAVTLTFDPSTLTSKELGAWFSPVADPRAR